jgi:hypothetical protein
VFAFAAWSSIQVVDLLNLISPDSAKQNSQTAEAFVDDMIETRPDWRAEDVICFVKFIRQEAGAVNTRTLNILQLTDLITEFEDKRAEEREQIYRKEKAEQLERKATSKEAEEQLRQIREKLEAERAKPEPLVRQADPMRDKVNGFIKEHDNLRNREGFAKYKGHMLDVTDYVQTRLNEEV